MMYASQFIIRLFKKNVSGKGQLYLCALSEGYSTLLYEYIIIYTLII